MGRVNGELLPKAFALTRYASRGLILGIISAAGAELENQLTGFLTRRHLRSVFLPNAQDSVPRFLMPVCAPLATIFRGLERTSDLNATLAQSESIKQELKMFILPQIRELLAENPVVLFMKGTPDSPECGFSKFASMLLKYNNISFVGVDVLDDPALRQGIKLYGNWPTIPQLYVKGELIGGSDIIQQLHESGELRKVCGLPD
ncbi:Glutaredoxin-related protein [Giardia lamblia P15]|uniref:Glutaredoxin-related protein n=1 Tax=Giardia intestinalis (strain P15) TaxID=658858 RepID=E1EXJ1_GIAIA|nr:Glutaredoxin-related protein [Giardia lamblia P15]